MCQGPGLAPPPSPPMGIPPTPPVGGGGLGGWGGGRGGWMQGIATFRSVTGAPSALFIIGGRAECLLFRAVTACTGIQELLSFNPSHPKFTRLESQPFKST